MDDEKYSTKGPVCPYCEHEHTPDEAFYYQEDYDMDCGECGEEFRVSTYVETSWTSKKPKEQK